MGVRRETKLHGDLLSSSIQEAILTSPARSLPLVDIYDFLRLHYPELTCSPSWVHIHYPSSLIV